MGWTSDERVTAALQGDERALEGVITCWLPQLYAWCGRLGAIDPKEAADDVVMLLVRRREVIHGPDHLPSWLFASCRRVVANHRRRAWWRRWVPGFSVDNRVSPTRTDLAYEERELATRVAAVLDTLRADHREVLVLCYIEDRTVAEAAELLGIPAGTVKSRLFAARSRFEKRYREDGP